MAFVGPADYPSMVSIKIYPWKNKIPLLWILDIGYSRYLSKLMTIQTIHWISDTIMGTFRGIGIHIGIYGRNHPIFEVGWLLRPNHDQLPRNPGVVSSVDRYYPCDFVDDKFYGPKDHRDQLPPPGIQKGIPFKG